MGCLVIIKARDRNVDENQRVKENMELHKEVERLQAEINCLNDHTRAETKRLTNLCEEAKRLQMEKAQEATSLNEEKNKLLSTIKELEKEVTCRGEDLTKATESFTQDATQSYLVGSEAALEQAATVHPTLDSLELCRGKTMVDGQLKED